MKENRCKLKPSEFFDIAAQQGYYGLEGSGLSGKKDYVRKYWEDIAIKLTVRAPVEKLMQTRPKLRVVDLGCGSGEGYELLTHIPASQPAGKSCFVLLPEHVSYTGIDVSSSMLEQGRKIYENRKNVQFHQVDLNSGFPLRDEKPFDIYFSSYSSLSHLTPAKLENLLEDIFNHAVPGSIVVLDMVGKYSLEWPKYWTDARTMLPYNMAYLAPEEPVKWYDVCFWNTSMLHKTLYEASKNTKTGIQIIQCIDRSIFVGRHMETGLFGAPRLTYRYQVNHLFDHEHREEIEHLLINLDWCSDLARVNPDVWARLWDYKEKWNCIINLVHALLHGNDSTVSSLIETTSQDISGELKFLTWLYRNAHRFPAVDFWASIMGPQIAVILRNIEMSLGPALGCGHGLFCVVEVTD